MTRWVTVGAVAFLGLAAVLATLVIVSRAESGSGDASARCAPATAPLTEEAARATLFLVAQALAEHDQDCLDRLTTARFRGGDATGPVAESMARRWQAMGQGKCSFWAEANRITCNVGSATYIATFIVEGPAFLMDSLGGMTGTIGS